MKTSVNIQVRVKGDFSAYHKQKVFVSFCPADLEQLDKVIDDIWKSVNCAVYYHADDLKADEIDLDDFGMKLNEMKLFVIIITTAYLSGESLSRNWEYEFAVKHHIPIIPIALETGLEDLFTSEMNKTGKGLGDIQLLNAYSTDTSEISYQQKLSRRLHSILVDDNEAEKIRQAFSGKIFLSYRKKDRKYANELMRTIHNIRSLQNVAIWFDEFIATGEKWSEQIGEALKTCDLFMLMLTPSLTEPDNYVVRVEYPAARQQKKTIVPVAKSEEIKTENKQSELKQLFPGLRTLVDGDNADELEKALIELSGEDEGDPEKEYLIGQAFFNGIEVEKDYERGASLIVAAAQKGLPAAVKRLAEMYWEGDGIAVNYENSILWRKELVNIYESELTDSEERSGYLNALEDLSICLFELSSFREALVYAQKLAMEAERDDSQEYVLERMRAYDLCGRLCIRLSMYDKAIAFAGKYHEICRLINDSEHSITSLHNLSASGQRLGHIYYACGDLERARVWYTESLEISRKIDQDLKSYGSADSLSAIYLLLGDLEARQERYDEAASWYEQALELRRKLLDASGSDRNRKEYAEAMTSLGTAYLPQMDLKKAEQLFKTAKDILEELCERNPTAEYQHACSVALNRLGELYKSRGEYNRSLEYYEDSLSRRESILKRIRTAETVFEYALTLMFKARVLASLTEEKEAVRTYDESIYYLKQLLPKDRSGKWHYLFANAAFERFTLDTFSSKQCLMDTIEAWKWLADKNPENTEYQKQYEQCRRIFTRCYPAG